MKKTKKTRMFNFLVELLLVIVIFAISSIVVVKMFYHGHDLNIKNQELNEAMFIAGDVAEQMRIYNGQDLATYLDYETSGDYQVVVDVDKTCDNYCLYTSNIQVLKDENVIVEYTVKSVGDNYE